MSSSSLKKYLKRKTHKERSQPEFRKKYGLLEKHKDYVERARRYQRQRGAIEVLQRKAAERNPDEFYFAMEHQRMKEDGVVERTEDENLSKDELMLEATQTLGYINTMMQRERKAIEKLQAQLHFLGVPVNNNHTVFVDSEAEARNFSPEAFFDTPKELLDRKFNRPTNAQLKSSTLVAGCEAATEVVEESQKSRCAKYKLLSERIQRHQKLKRIAAKMVLKKQLAKDGDVRKYRDEDGNMVYKWRQERKK